MWITLMSKTLRAFRPITMSASVTYQSNHLVIVSIFRIQGRIWFMGSDLALVVNKHDQMSVNLKKSHLIFLVEYKWPIQTNLIELSQEEISANEWSP